ncbi:hypothetical protein D3C85_1413720 [compost metagenome]
MGRLELFLPRLQHDEPDNHHHDAHNQRGQPWRHHHAQAVDGGHQQDDEPRQQDNRPPRHTGNAGLERGEAGLQLGLGQRQLLAEEIGHFTGQLPQQSDYRGVLFGSGQRS